MNSHTATPIYKDAYSLAKLLAQHITKMPRDFKSLYGVDLKVHTLGVLRDIRYANKARDGAKVPHPTKLLDRLEDANDLLRIAQELGHLKTPHYAAAIQLTGSVGRQAGGLRKKYAPAA
jgi:hypothetical protein